MKRFEDEVGAGERFEFGRNWQRLLASIDGDRIATAEASLRTMLGVTDLHDRRFLDIGSGSGLFSLAARRLGATVHSFDFDPQAVGCTRTLKERFCPGDEGWRIERGSVLDAAFVDRLERADIVYSWGVLHHTGDMWRAIELAASRVAAGGVFFLALYNDQGWKSRGWRVVKRAYNALPRPLKPLYSFGAFAVVFAAFVAKHTLRLRPLVPFASLRENRRRRGMSPLVDWTDWVGGYPYEVASVDTVTRFFAERGFDLKNLRPTTSLGCSEFVFARLPEGA